MINALTFWAMKAIGEVLGGLLMVFGLIGLACVVIYFSHWYSRYVQWRIKRGWKSDNLTNRNQTTEPSSKGAGTLPQGQIKVGDDQG